MRIHVQDHGFRSRRGFDIRCQGRNVQGPVKRSPARGVPDPTTQGQAHLARHIYQRASIWPARRPRGQDISQSDSVDFRSSFTSFTRNLQIIVMLVFTLFFLPSRSEIHDCHDPIPIQSSYLVTAGALWCKNTQSINHIQTLSAMAFEMLSHTDIPSRPAIVISNPKNNLSSYTSFPGLMTCGKREASNSPLFFFSFLILHWEILDSGRGRDAGRHQGRDV